MPKKQRKAPAPLAARQGTTVCALALLGYFVCLGLVQLVSTFFPALLLLEPGAGWRETARLFFWNALPNAAVLPPILWGAHTLRLGPPRMGLCRPRAGIPLGFEFFFLGLSMFTSTAGGLLGRALGLRSSPILIWLPERGISLAAAFLALCVLPALAEEVFFRGLLRTALRPFGPDAAVWGTALLFALSHGSLPQCLTALVSGWALGLCAECCGSIWPGVALHFANNALAFLIAWLELYTDPSSAGLASLVIAVVLLIEFVTSMVWPDAIRRSRRRIYRMDRRHGWKLPHAKRGEPDTAALFADPAFRITLACLALLAVWRCVQ